MHYKKEELLPISQWIIKSPLEYSELYLAGKIPGSNMHRVSSVEQFVKENSNDAMRDYWKKFICFANGTMILLKFNPTIGQGLNFSLSRLFYNQVEIYITMAY